LDHWADLVMLISQFSSPESSRLLWTQRQT
jgi:hypothetical protein